MTNKFFRAMPPLPSHVTFLEMLRHSCKVLHCNGFMTDKERERVWRRIEKDFIKEELENDE